jgi:predicted ATPase/transcriptional regulator with XRE-family HTH domain/Tfp pilus assembly protein PilF
MDSTGSPKFGDLLRRYRLAAGLTQEELAEKAQVSPRAISDLERGLRNRPWRDTIQFLADALKLAVPERSQLEAAARHGTPITDEQARERPHQGASEIPLPAAERRSARRTNLPAALTPLIGREHEVAAIAELLGRSDVRLVTLTGPGGIGKTSLALAVARELSRGARPNVVFVALESIVDYRLVASAIAEALEVREVVGRGLWETLREQIQERELLLLLDNFEQVLEATPDLAALLGACANVKLLVTSRSPLQVPGEREFPVPPLTVPVVQPGLSAREVEESAGVQLFLARAQGIKPDFRLTPANAPVVAEICRRLDGIPLAIELAAALVKALSVEVLAARLTDRFHLLTRGSRAGLPRHQTLQATIDWSYNLLTEPQRALFRRLAVFAGGFSLEAAEVVGADEGVEFQVGEDHRLVSPKDVLPLLAHLIDASLVVQEEAGDQVRYRLLDTMRAYGITLLAASGEKPVSEHQHATYFGALVDEAERQYTSEGPQSSIGWDARLGPERANLRAALTWCRENDLALGLRLAVGLAWFWIFRRDAVEGQSWLETFLAQTTGAPGVRGRALLGLATLKRDQGYLAAAQPLFEEALALSRQVGDDWGIARGLIQLAQQARTAGDYERGVALSEESLAVARKIRVLDSIIWALTTLGQLHHHQGDFGRARARLEEARREGPGDLDVLYTLGRTEEKAGRFARAEAAFQEALDRDQQVSPDVCGWLLLLGRLARKQGDGARARRLIEEGLAVARQNSATLPLCLALYDLAERDWVDRDSLSAYARFAEALTLGQREGNLQSIARGLLVGAKQAADSGVLIRAIRLFGAADQAMPHYRFEQDMIEVTDYERSLKAARAALDPAASAATWAEGQAMTLEEAVAYALAE